MQNKVDEHKLGWRREVYGWGKLKQSLTDLDTLEVFFFLFLFFLTKSSKKEKQLKGRLGSKAMHGKTVIEPAME